MNDRENTINSKITQTIYNQLNIIRRLVIFEGRNVYSGDKRNSSNNSLLSKIIRNISAYTKRTNNPWPSPLKNKKGNQKKKKTKQNFQ